MEVFLFSFYRLVCKVQKVNSVIQSRPHSQSSSEDFPMDFEEEGGGRGGKLIL